jgi:hypothetical protein
MGALIEENELIRSLVRKETEAKQILADQVAELSVRAGIVEHLETALRTTELRLAEVAATSGARNEKIDELRAEKARTAHELKEARASLEQLSEATDNVDAIGRMTVFARARASLRRPSATNRRTWPSSSPALANLVGVFQS